ncbi:MAG: endonuclease [Candidatus Krumholzibacteriia bacterium]
MTRKSSLCRVLLSAALVFIAAVALADAPAGYYATVDLTSPATCRATLHDLIDGHIRYPYTSSSTDTWDVLEYADEDPLNTSNILDLYKNHSYVKFGGGTGPYNREHSWPNSYGFSSSGDVPYTDCHALFLCDVSYNSSRGNEYFDDCISGCTSYPADTYNGESGVNLSDANSWETWQGRKGDVARAMFYMDVRYEGDSGEVDLVLTDNPALIVVTDGSVAYMGLTATLLAWHQDDPVDAREMRRNDRVQQYQQNRNPFVDHPEWVDYLFGSGVISGVGDRAPAVVAVGIDRIVPNPFNPRTTIEYTVARTGPVTLAVYDLAGRRVRTLVSGPISAGEHQVPWDGRDQSGRALPSATYFCRLEGQGQAVTGKLTLLK